MSDLRKGAEILDHPEVLRKLLFPHLRNAPDAPNAVNCPVQVSDDVQVGCRFFRAMKDAPNILFFHGNGETAADYDAVAPVYGQFGLNLFVAEYRGYGMSGGRPTCSGILRDTDSICDGFFDFLEKTDLTGEPYVMGRSLGSAPAIETAYNYPTRFKGLIVESGFSAVDRQLERLGVSHLFEDIDDPVGFGNDRKIEKIRIPTLIIHGEMDRIIPVEEGKSLYQLSGAREKESIFIAYAGHNDLWDHDLESYMNGLKQFTQR